ncbi:MAG: DUF4352 domain-containing protein [Nanoarchaeota archaeon]|nr:DUF4352 domain-containing protein [Nanoarchaeota archaeon]
MKKLLYIVLFLAISLFAKAELDLNIYTDTKDGIRVQFSVSEDYVEGIFPGNVKVSIINNLGDTVFSKDYIISEKDYKPVQASYDNFTGIELSLPEESIQKSKGTSSGTIFIDFSGAAGSAKGDSYIYGLPQMSKEELTEASTSEYAKVAVPISITSEGLPGLRISITRHGEYTDYDYQATKKTRVDIVVENTGASKISFSLYGSSLVDTAGKQHPYSYKTPTSAIDVFPGEKKDAFVLFDEAGTPSKLYLGEEIIFDLDKKTASTVAELSEAKYHEEAKLVNFAKQIKGKIEAKVERYGMTEIDGKDVLRFDISISNIGTSPIYYQSEAALVTSAGISIKPLIIYKSNFPNAFEDGDVQPGVSRKGALFFEIDAASAKELVLDSGQELSGGTLKIDDAEQIAGTKNYWFRFQLDGSRPKQEEEKKGGFPALEWDLIGVAGLLITVVSIVFGWWASKKHRHHTVTYIDKMDDIYHKYNNQQGVCLEQMTTLKKELEQDFKKGKIDEQDFQLVFQKIEDYIGRLSGK